MLELEGLGHRIQVDGPQLFDDINVALKPGRLCAVVGPNGSGKSTLLRILAGILTPTAGKVSLDGEDMGIIGRRTRAKKLAYLPQSTPLYHELMVKDLVKLGRMPYQTPLSRFSASDDEAVAQAIASVGLSGFESRSILKLSGGELKRALLARLLATQAPVMLLDEPTAGLDVGHALDFYGLLKDLCAQGHTLVVVMHELQWARRYGDDAILLTTGAQSHCGEAKDVLTATELGEVFKIKVEESPLGPHFFPEKL